MNRLCSSCTAVAVEFVFMNCFYYYSIFLNGLKPVRFANACASREFTSMAYAVCERHDYMNSPEHTHIYTLCLLPSLARRGFRAAWQETNLRHTFANFILEVINVLEGFCADRVRAREDFLARVTFNPWP